MNKNKLKKEILEEFDKEFGVMFLNEKLKDGNLQEWQAYRDKVLYSFNLPKKHKDFISKVIDRARKDKIEEIELGILILVAEVDVDGKEKTIEEIKKFFKSYKNE